MVGFTIIAGALISLVGAYALAELMFGRSSSAGYHGRGGRFKTKGQGTELKLAKMFSVGAIVFVMTGAVAGLLASLGPFGAILLAFVVVFVFLHLDIDQWNFP